MKRILLFVLFTLPFVLQGQSGILTGRILDNTNFPLIGADVQIDNQGGTVADDDGYYYMALPAGDHSARVSYIGYESVTFEFTILEDQTMIKDIILPTGVTLSEVVITSNLKGQSRALNQQLTNTNITNIIAADQIGRFPDGNIGDAMKRIPGINVQYDQGEARFGNIRGTAPELSSVMINGERVPSAEAEIRSVQLDLVPSDMVQSVEVSKAVTPDMDADAIGGSVNLVTRAAPAGQRVSATLGTGYNLVAEKPSTNLSLVYGNRFANDKVGLIVSGSYFNNPLGSDNVEAEWDEDDGNVFLDELQIRQYYLQRARQSYSASLDFKLAPTHTIFLKGMYNQRNDWENRYRAVYKKIEQEDDQWLAKIERQTKAGIKDNKYGRLEDQDVLSLSLSGDHKFGKLSMDWSGNYAKASEERPNERYFEYGSDDAVPINYDISNPRKPLVSAIDADYTKPTGVWEIGEITEEYQYTEDEDVNAKLNFGYQLATGDNASLLKFGLRSRNKSKNRDNDFYEYKPLDEDAELASSLSNLESQTKDNFLPGDQYKIGEFTTKEYLGGLDLDNASLFEKEQDLSELAGNFDASENILAGYAMIEQNFGKDFLVIAGLRAENTKNKYQGFQYQEEDEDNGLEESLTKTKEEESSYTNVLPGVHLKYNVSKRTVLRAAWTNTIARANYFDLVPYREIAEGNELSIGNPDLEPTTSSNIDLMAEHYFGTIGLVSAGVFYKDIKDFIVGQKFDDYTFEGKEYGEFSQSINGGNASLLGFEVAFQRQLDIISERLKALGLYMNYTYTSSKVTDFNFDGREDEDLSLPGSPEHTLNASLAYEGKKFTSRLSYNFASDFIAEVGGEAFSDIYYDAVNYLDFNFNYNVNQNFNIYLNVNNILNQPLRYYQGISDRVYQQEYYNVRFDIGLKYDLFN